MNKIAEDKISLIKNILQTRPAERGNLIALLQDIQQQFGYLPQQAIDELSKLLDISANEIYGVATFYSQFRFNPPAEHTIKVCQGTACHVRGSANILTEIEQHLGIKAGQRSKDGKFDIERVACMGCCALAPVVVVDETVNAKMTASKVSSLLAKYGAKRGKNK